MSAQDKVGWSYDRHLGVHRLDGGAAFIKKVGGQYEVRVHEEPKDFVQMEPTLDEARRCGYNRVNTPPQTCYRCYWCDATMVCQRAWIGRAWANMLPGAFTLIPIRSKLGGHFGFKTAPVCTACCDALERARKGQERA